MPELSMRKRLNVVRFFLQGFAYEEIVSKAGVSKGSVVNVINELRAGHFPQVKNLDEEAEALREVAVGLRRTQMSVSQASIGLLALQGLEILGVEPSELEEVVALYRQLSPEGMETATFVRAAMTLKQVSEKTGKDPEELEVWVEGSEARARELERQCRDLTPMAEEVEGLKQHRDSMTREMAALNSRKEVLETKVEEQEQRLDWLQEEVGNTERLIEELGRRYLQREGEARKLEDRLNEARRSIAEISRLGLPLERFPELAGHLTSAAHHQGIDLDQFLDWFISCLQGSSSLLGLETLIKAKREQLQVEERALAAASKERDRYAAQVQELKKERIKEEAARRTAREAWREEVLSVGTILKEAASQERAALKALGGSLRKEIHSSHEECRITAVEMGRLAEAIDSYAIVRPLISLLQGKDGLAAGEVRIVATALSLGLMGYLERNGEKAKADGVASRVKLLLESLERWKV